MRQLKNTHTAPPGGWRYIDPTTQYLYDKGYRGFSDLIRHIESYRAQNDLEPIPQLEMVVQEWLAHQPNVPFKNVPTPRKINEYFRGGLAMAKALLVVSPFCSQSVAEKRAETCARCRYNELPKEKGRIESMTDLAITSVVGNRKTKSDRKLFMCSVCSCPLKAKVHFARDIIESELTVKERHRLPNGFPGKDGKPLYCWQIKPIKEEE